MITTNHEVMHHIFKSNPQMLKHAARALDVPLPDPIDVAVLSGDLTEFRALERRMDTLLQVTTTTGIYRLIVEAQTGQDLEKLRTWVYSVGYLHAKHKDDVALMVVCQDITTAEWARRPITIELAGWTVLTVNPLVLGPDNVPAITEPAEAAEDILLTMLSAITHAHDSQITAILRALATALHDVDEEDRALIIEMTELGLGRTQAVETWRTLMSISLSYFRSETSQRLRAEGRTVGFDEGLEKGVQKGRAEAVAEMILHLLDVRDVPTTAKVRRRIQACTDLDTLDTWFHRSINAATGDDIVTG